ncbi:hypothetical protein WJX72_007225 [[Myrmecia] bisecta]|uniref:Ubiquitin-like domain-containing protein n=1 Tax=[Myrmecia] bisecta TaxID=41462 RepID=A0AAW1QBT1_9CHLO
MQLEGSDLIAAGITTPAVQKALLVALAEGHVVWKQPDAQPLPQAPAQGKAQPAVQATVQTVSTPATDACASGAFHPAATFQGCHAGYVYKLHCHGLGYYMDEQSSEAFRPAAALQGRLPGYAYKTGCHGLGYYKDERSATASASGLPSVGDKRRLEHVSGDKGNDDNDNAVDDHGIDDVDDDDDGDSADHDAAGCGRAEVRPDTSGDAQSSQAPTFEISVKFLFGEQLALTVCSYYTLGTVKYIIADKTGIQASDLRLIFGARQLPDDPTLAA